MDKLIFWQAATLQFSGILGAGIFILPYLFSQSNFVFSIFFVVVVVLLISTINIFYSYIILHTKGDHQLPGYCQIYLGRRFRLLAVINIFLLTFGALTAYLKLASASLQTLIPFLDHSYSSILIIAFISLLFLGRFVLTKKISKILPLFVLILTVLLLIYSVEYQLFPLSDNPYNINFFGALVFSLTGFTLLPEVEELLRTGSSRRLLSQASVLGLVMAAITSLIFCYAIITLAGPYLTPDIITGISKISPALSGLISFIILLVTINASQNFLNILKETFHRDLALAPLPSSLLAILFPFVGFLFANLSFVSLISLTGAVTIFVSATLICTIRLKINRNPLTTFLAFTVLSTMFLGLLSELISL